MPCTNFVFENVNSHGWWHYLGISYFVENVHGTITDSKPVPAFVTPEGDGFVGNDNLAQLIGLVWTALIDLVTPNSTKTIKTLESAVGNFNQFYRAIAF